MRRSILLATASVAAVLQAQPVLAQADSGDAGLSTTDTPIVVTALKREQLLIDVPMAISVLGGEELQDRGIESIQDLSFAVPGLTMREDGPGSYTIFLRGLANQSGSGALVGLYLNETPLSLSGFDQLSPSALDLERVEVLKGPQGTLYGQGSAAGTVRYITVSPDLNDFEGRVTGELYDVSRGEIGARGTAIVNMPIVRDQLAVRIAASYEDGGGWIDQPEAGIEDGNGTETLVVRGTLLWQPVDNFSAEAMVQIHRADTRLGLGFEEADRTVDIGMDRSIELLPKEFNFNIYNLVLNYDFGFAELTSSTSYVEHDHQYPFTYIPRPGNYSFGIVEGNDDRFVDADQFSQELRLSSSDGPLQWTIGGYYSDGERSLIAHYGYLYAPAGDLYSGGGVLYDNLYYLSASTSETYSLFADASYDITDNLTFGFGVRYFHDDQTSLIEYAPNTGTVQSATFDSIDPRIFLSYQYASDARLYVSYAEGFRSGGFNSAPFDPYEPENIQTYEIGTRGSVGGGALQFDIAGYYTIYSDMIRRRLVNVNGQFLGESSNIGEVEARGIEIGLAAHPTDSLTFSVTGSYIDSVITDTDPGDQVNIIGDRTDYTPELSYTLSGQYDFALGDAVTGFARIDYNYRDAVSYIDRSSFFPDVLPQMSDDISQLNARVGFDFGRVDLELYALNITNENRSIDPYQGWANANRTRPRVIGARVGVDF